MNKIISLVAAASLLATAGSSCGIYKKYDTPTDTPLTQAYADARSQAPDSTAFGNLLWEDVFTDPILAHYISTALNQNTSLRNAMLNVDIAHAQLRGARLAYLPSVALAPNGAGASYAGSDINWTYQLPVQVSWEIDIFGKLLNSKRSAQESFYLSEAYARAARSQIIAAVANTYYGLWATRAQLDLARSTAEVWKQTVSTMEDFKLVGNVTEAAVVQSRAQYYSILSTITDLEQAADKLNNTLCLLLNRLPDTQLETVSGDGDKALQIGIDPSTGVPMNQLAWRPDVEAAERQLAVAYYATSGARAAFYPGLTINATGGFTNLLGSFVQNPGDWFYQLAASLVAPLFSRGRNIAALQAAKATQKQAMNSFEYTLMKAAAEVSDALVVYTKSSEKEEYLAQQVSNLEKAADYSMDLLRYNQPGTTYLDVLTAQSNLLQSRMNAISSRLAQAQAVINLYQALGGGR
ncbi:MAG: efflux transporter outer membrane subunit [Muribaculaceae bacterium]|nr:efflux transporter outer membrane subunit [Muribaculaceae bacterium]